jgi:hypothetical protein
LKNVCEASQPSQTKRSRLETRNKHANNVDSSRIKLANEGAFLAQKKVRTSWRRCEEKTYWIDQRRKGRTKSSINATRRFRRSGLRWRQTDLKYSMEFYPILAMPESGTHIWRLSSRVCHHLLGRQSRSKEQGIAQIRPALAGNPVHLYAVPATNLLSIEESSNWTVLSMTDYNCFHRSSLHDRLSSNDRFTIDRFAPEELDLIHDD